MTAEPDAWRSAARAEELASLGYWHFDLISREVTVSPGMRRILGLADDDRALTPELLLPLLHPDDHQRVASELAKMATKKLPLRIEHRLLLPGGLVKHVRSIGDYEDQHAQGITQDVTDAALAALALERERDLSRAVLGSLQEGYLLLKTDVILEVNEALCRMTGFSASELLGVGSPYPFWPREQVRSLDGLRHRILLDDGGTGQFALTRRDGTNFDAAITATPLPVSEEGERLWVVVLRDITQQREYERHLVVRAETDPLTGLVNSRTFRDALRAATTEAGKVGLALLDIDHFKSINDVYGHAVGDEVLVEVARRLTRDVGGEGMVARVGGEEFALLVNGQSMPAAQRLVERVLEGLRAEPFGAVGRVTASAGLAELAEGMTDDTLYRQADSRLYQAKADGRDRLRWS